MSRWWSRALILGLAVLFLASVSLSCGRTLLITDAQGAPVAGAYVAYHHEGTTYGIAESLTYEASRIDVLRSDAAGQVAVPWAMHLHWPLIQSGSEIAVNLVYAPALHNGLASVNRRVAVSRPREFDVSADLKTVRLEDLTTDPALWQGTLMNLGSLLSRLTSQEMRGEPTPALLDELIEEFRKEYLTILAHFGETPRPSPDMPEAVRWATDQEKTAWRAMVERDLSERPRWGDELKRQFATEFDIYGRRK
jgi:hypothetical protein